MRRFRHWTLVVLGWLAIIFSILGMFSAAPDETLRYEIILNAVFVIFLAWLLIRVMRRPPRGKRMRYLGGI